MKRDPGTHFKLPETPQGLQKVLPALTKLAPQAGKVLLTCPICLIDFSRHACHARRNRVNYCSTGCASEGAKVVVETECLQCGKAMLSSPSTAARVVTCSRICSSERKRSRAVESKQSSWAAYRAAAKQMALLAKCTKCGVTHGPWVVRGIKMDVVPGAEPTADLHQAALWCKRCHLQDIAPLGAPARANAAKPSNAK